MMHRTQKNRPIEIKILLFIVIVTASVFSVPAHAGKVCNAGFPGDNSLQLLHRLPSALAACPAADAVVIFVGMNDAVNEKRFLSPQQTRENVETMLHLLASKHITAVVVTVHFPDLRRLMERHEPSAYGSLSPSERIDNVNDALWKAAAAGGARVADFHAALEKAGGPTFAMSTDGVHLTRKGYRLLAMTVRTALPSKARGETVLCLGDSLTYGIGVRAPNDPEDNPNTYPEQLQSLLNSHL